MRKPVDEVNALIASGRRKMIEARRARPAPAIDRNILSDWNGMMVSSYLKAYKTLGDEEARAFALKTLDFVVKRTFNANAGMYHSLLGSGAPGSRPAGRPGDDRRGRCSMPTR